MNRLSLRSKQKGLGMPEVMVAMMLLGIAIVGFSALQVKAISATGESAERTQAAAIASDLAERIRLNAGGLATYQAPWNPTASANNACEVANCTPAQMARYDIRQVTDLAAATLPNGRVAVQTCPTRVNMCIYVAWNKTNPTVGAAAPNCQAPTGLYVQPTAPESTDCVFLETK